MITFVPHTSFPDGRFWSAFDKEEYIGYVYMRPSSDKRIEVVDHRTGSHNLYDASMSEAAKEFYK